MNITEISSQVQTFSRLLDRGDAESTDLKEELVKLASDLRAREISYQFEYTRPDQANFRLRSTDGPGGDACERVIHFLEPGRRLRVVMDGVPEDVFDGLCEELTILGENDELKGNVIREPELNLLTSRAFQAELYAEFQRWERYDSPLYVISVHITASDNWQPAAKALKHVGKQRDILGLFRPSRVVGFFSSRTENESFRSELTERIEATYSNDELDLTILHIPTDCSDWTELQEAVAHSQMAETN